jgi:hypothetical protein
MIFKQQVSNPAQWTSFFCWFPVSETIIKEDRSAVIMTYWLVTIQRKLITNSMTGLVRWDYRKSPISDDGINAA